MVSDLTISKTTASIVKKSENVIEGFTRDVDNMPRDEQLGVKKGLQAAIADRQEKILKLKWRKGVALSESQMETLGKPISDGVLEITPKWSIKEKKMVDVEKYFNPFGLERLDVHSIATQRAIPAECSDLAKATQRVDRARTTRALAEKTVRELEAAPDSDATALANAIQYKRDAIASHDTLLQELGVDGEKVATLHEVGQALLKVLKLENKERIEKHNAHVHINRAKISVLTSVMARDDKVDARTTVMKKYSPEDTQLIGKGL